MKTLYLHIGTGKTGSTSIQKTFCSLKSSAIDFRFDGNGVVGVGTPEDFLSRLESSSKETIVYSNEWLFKAGDKFLGTFSQKLREIYKVKVVLYIRRQDEFVVSAYQQAAKNSLSSSEFGSIALPWAYPEVNLNYYKIASRWAQYFGEDNIIVRVFSGEQLIGGCAVRDFAEVIGAPMEASEVIQANESAGVIAVKLGHILNSLGVNLDEELREELVLNAPESVKSLPDKASAELFYERFRPSNALLKEKFKINSPYESIFNSDFSKYPALRSDLWTDDLANEAIVHILNTFLLSKSEGGDDVCQSSSDVIAWKNRAVNVVSGLIGRIRNLRSRA
ncbi:hypothetical protein ACG1BZ_14640 [Microbulbifer sp. CNSA002]|uniref:hypothetical protein n=1 Tax=unclassified Microbulbifer TaxID=2619833 RepID=UPI0039B47ADA